MADKLPEKDSSRVETRNIAQQIESQKKLAENQRKSWARHWYDNNFFDDGHHFRFISRTSGRIVDLSEKASLYTPRRAIPKASRQIRGMANLILSPDFVPLVKPTKINVYNFGGAQDPNYLAAREEAKIIAKRSGQWVEESWKDQELDIKLALMVLLAAKNYISYLQVWPDADNEGISTQVYDAFDVYLVSTVSDIYDSPFIGKIIPKTIREIKSNQEFDKEQLERINPDNRYASDEIKEAYLASQFGNEGRPSDDAATLLLHEWFIKERLGEDNGDRIRKQKDGGKILSARKTGDIVIRHIFTAGKVWLYDEYEDIPDYPFVDFRWEPGRIYGVAPIERFISANKSLDSIMSRLERFTHTMNVGVWMKRKGEGFKISNVAGGLMAEYEGVPPQQMPMASFPTSAFNFIELLNSFIEEQGVTTSALGKIPRGVKAWGAIESLKASEFANLHIPIKQLKKTVKGICEKMLDIADRYFVSPQTIYRLNKGEPDYFDIIGKSSLEKRKEIKEEGGIEGAIPISRDYKVEIEIESGLGYTEEGKKGRMMELATFMLNMAQAGYLTPEAVKLVIERLLEMFKFGSVAEMMEALEGLGENQQLDGAAMQQTKLALLETLKDASEAGLFKQPAQEQVAATKVGVAETIRDLQGGGKSA